MHYLLAAIGFGSLGALSYVFRDRLRVFTDRLAAKLPKGALGSSFEVPMPEGDPVVGPAYPYLSRWTARDRAALYNAQRELGLDIAIGAIPGVIQHESGGDPTAPHQATGTPRGGLIQLTQGARLPGFDTALSVWAVREMSVPEQCAQVIVPYYRRMNLAPDTSLVRLMRLNFLPGVADKPSSFVLGVRPGATGPGGETSETPLMPGLPLTLGQIFTNNSGFARGKDFFTWADADADAAKAESKAGGKTITVSGKVS